MCQEDQGNGFVGEIRDSSWLIERRLPDGQLCGRYLQIGTGQWCPSQYATRFPLRRTAVAYAHEFGYSVGYTAEIVPYQAESC
jgi:hypothetical protein